MLTIGNFLIHTHILFCRALFVNFIAFSAKVKTGTWGFTSNSAIIIQQSLEKNDNTMNYAVNRTGTKVIINSKTAFSKENPAPKKFAAGNTLELVHHLGHIMTKSFARETFSFCGID